MRYELPQNRQIAAVIPHYTAGGDCSRLYTTDGRTILLRCRPRAIVRQLARRQVVDLCALKAQASRSIQRKNGRPLPLAADLVLVPLKVRRPLISGDITFGYINLYAIDAVKEMPGRPGNTAVRLHGNEEVPVLWKVSTVRARLQDARLLTRPDPTARLCELLYRFLRRHF